MISSLFSLFRQARFLVSRHTQTNFFPVLSLKGSYPTRGFLGKMCGR